MQPKARILVLATAAMLAATAAGNAGAQDQDILRPEEAFPYTLAADGDGLRLRFEIPDGYYLYRKRFGFGSNTPAVSLRPASFPKGEIHEDEFFGEMEVYRGDFEITIPYARRAAADAMELELKLQGCADIGLCYPPQTWTPSVNLPPGGAAGQADVGNLLRATNADGLLPVDQAFVMNARFDAANEVTVSWQIEPGYYLYRDKFEFEADGGIQLGAARLPEGEAHYDDNFGDVRVFYGYVEAVIPFARASGDELPVTIRADYQGCKENSICYPPDRQTMSLALPASSEFALASSGDSMVSEQDRLTSLVLSDSWWIVLGTFYGFGLLLAFTPCVLPMVPILSGVIAGQKNVSTGRGFALSVSYVLGMAVTYTAAGALAAMAGNQIQAVFQKPWIITLFSGLFVVLALGMFGVFHMQMPAAIQTRLAQLQHRQSGGTFAGTAVIGALSALIVTTCVAPPLVATLAVIGQSGDVVRGAAALFALSLGMGSPLLVVGASAGKLLPKVGPWMNTVKAAFGVMMIGLAIWMMERVLAGTITLALWALLVFLTGVFLGAFEPLPAEPQATRRLSKGVGVLACLYGAIMLIGSTLGGEDPLAPLPRGLNLSGTMESRQALAFEPVETVAALEAALNTARASGQPVMIDFTADWCVSCREMEEYTFPDAKVITALEPYMLLRADVTANDADDQALLQYFDSYGPPTIAFFDRAGTQRNAYKLVGYVPADDFRLHVERLAAL